MLTLSINYDVGINAFLAGFIPTENLRFREEELNFKLATNIGMRTSFSMV